MNAEMTSLLEIVMILLVTFMGLVFMVVKIALGQHRKKLMVEIRNELLLFRKSFSDE